jgi:hypothetical protein
VDTFLTTDEASKALRIPAATLKYWRWAGKGPRATKLGRRVLYAERDLIDWVESERTDSGRAS